MKLGGYTNNNEGLLNWAIQNVARKLKVDIWRDGYINQKVMDDVPVNDRIDLLIDLSNKLYK